MTPMEALDKAIKDYESQTEQLIRYRRMWEHNENELLPHENSMFELQDIVSNLKLIKQTIQHIGRALDEAKATETVT